MGFECNHCGKRFVSEESMTQHSKAKHFSEVKEGGARNSVPSKMGTGVPFLSGKINFKKYILILMIGLIVVFSIVTIYSYSQRPGEYDDFAKCLTDSGAVVYGNDFCSYTGKQLNYFGNSDKYLNYVKCADDQALCDSKGVTLTPTWEINGKMYKSVQTFETLSALTGCEI